MKHLMLAAVALCIAACGPVYNTEYRYTPPADDRGRACAMQCNAQQTQCKTNAGLAAENERLLCELESREDFYSCQKRAKDDAARAQCERSTCSRDDDEGVAACENDFRTCFQTCGGKIDSFQVCTFNCP